jgi:hypothetical protein
LDGDADRPDELRLSTLPNAEGRMKLYEPCGHKTCPGREGHEFGEVVKGFSHPELWCAPHAAEIRRIMARRLREARP